MFYDVLHTFCHRQVTCLSCTTSHRTEHLSGDDKKPLKNTRHWQCVFDNTASLTNFKVYIQSLPNTSQNNPYKLCIAETRSMYLPQHNDVLCDRNLTTEALPTGATRRLPNRGPWRRSWLSRKVAGLIPDGVIWIFHWHNPSRRSIPLGSTQLLTEMSTGCISWG